MNEDSQFVKLTSSAGGSLRGSLRVPGDKSISHRSVMLASLANGSSEISGFLEGEDSLATVHAFRQMGVRIEGPDQGRVYIDGVGLDGLSPPPAALDLGNAGTAMRLMAGLMAGQAFSTELVGDASLMQRPMARVVDPLRSMGAEIIVGEGGRPPLKVIGGRPLCGIDYTMPVASAQVKSCLLLAGMYADGETRVTEPAPTRDHTERMLTGFGYPVRNDGASRSLRGGGQLSAMRVDVPADISSAAFFLVAGSIVADSDLLLEYVGINPTRTGVIDILRAMGANIEILNPRQSGGEPVADIRVRHAPLKGIEIPPALVPLAIDEFPVLFVAAARAEGRTLLRGAAELRVKESDRIDAMADGLRQLGLKVETWADGIGIEGGPIAAGSVDSRGDHRIAMAFAVAGLCSSGEVQIADCANVATSFPGFVDLAAQVGMTITEQRTIDKE